MKSSGRAGPAASLLFLCIITPVAAFQTWQPKLPVKIVFYSDRVHNCMFNMQNMPLKTEETFKQYILRLVWPADTRVHHRIKQLEGMANMTDSIRSKTAIQQKIYKLKIRLSDCHKLQISADADALLRKQLPELIQKYKTGNIIVIRKDTRVYRQMRLGSAEQPIPPHIDRLLHAKNWLVYRKKDNDSR